MLKEIIYNFSEANELENHIKVNELKILFDCPPNKNLFIFYANEYEQQKAKIFEWLKEILDVEQKNICKKTRSKKLVLARNLFMFGLFKTTNIRQSTIANEINLSRSMVSLSTHFVSNYHDKKLIYNFMLHMGLIKKIEGNEYLNKLTGKRVNVISITADFVQYRNGDKIYTKTRDVFEQIYIRSNS
jgi:hypothetical protein